MSDVEPGPRAKESQSPKSRRPASTGGAARIGLALLFVLLFGLLLGAPISLVRDRGPLLRDMILRENTRFTEITEMRVRALEPVLALAPTVDPDISSQEAGAAFYEMVTMVAEVQSNSPVPQRPPALHIPLPSLDAEDAPFRDIKAPGMSLPDIEQVFARVQRGLTTLERAWLADVAEHPVWEPFDLVARASAADMLGGRFVMPFPEWVYPHILVDFPITPSMPIQELVGANASRAAFLLAHGDEAGAERALVHSVGVGRALLDAPTNYDHLNGMGTLRRAQASLLAFYEATNHPRRAAFAAAVDAAAVVGADAAGGGGEQGSQVAQPEDAAGANPMTLEARRIAHIRGEAVPISRRFEAVLGLGMLRCSSVSGILFGPDEEIASVLAWALDSVARYESERAMIRAAENAPEALATRYPAPSAPLSIRVRLLNGWGHVLQNPAMRGCARVLGNMRLP